jgi:hypothetical protein
MLIDRGVDLHFANETGETPLHRACFGGEESVVRMLIDLGADVNVSTDDGWTPLFGACEMSYEYVVTMLIDCGADLNVTDDEGCTPLHRACGSHNFSMRHDDDISGEPEILRVLILAGADTQARDNAGKLPVEHLPDDDDESRAMYEEAVKEVDSRALKPVLK